MNKTLMSIAAGLALAFGAATTASAAPTQWAVGSGGNGHWYEWVAASSSGTTWTQARANALASTHMGMRGYLATVTSAAENAFLGTLSNDGWLGGSDQGTEGSWLWMDGPEAGSVFWTGGISGTVTGYASWNPGFEPNNLNNEDYLHRAGGLWNDLQNLNYSIGYYVEYSVNGVPSPGTLALAGLALAGLALSRCRKA